jgi:4-carboxymuconolactone decarboxylase
MANERTPMRAPWGDIAPRLTEISDTVLFDDVWRRPGLSPRDRSLITVASLIALYRSNEPAVGSTPGNSKRRGARLTCGSKGS